MPNGLEQTPAHQEHLISIVNCAPALIIAPGNGPSATFLSLMLSGYTPFYNGHHPNPFLAAKLRENPEVSLIDQVHL